MTLVPHDNDHRSISVVELGVGAIEIIVDWLYSLHDMLNFYSHAITFYLDNIAPIVVRYGLLKLGYSGIDALPYVDFTIKQEMKAWLRSYLR